MSVAKTVLGGKRGGIKQKYSLLMLVVTSEDHHIELQLVVRLQPANKSDNYLHQSIAPFNYDLQQFEIGNRKVTAREVNVHSIIFKHSLLL